MTARWVLLFALALLVALAGCGGGTWEDEPDPVVDVTLTDDGAPSNGNDDGTESDGTETGTPTETDTPRPTQTPGETYEFEGLGPATTESFALRGGFVVVDLRSNVDGNFEVWLEGDQEEYRLVNSDDQWDGRVAVVPPAGEYRIRIDSVSSWEVTVEQPTYPRDDAERLPVDVDGEDADFIPVEIGGATTIELEGMENADYAVRLVDQNGWSSRIAGGSGPGTWTATVDGSGVVLVQVHSTGDWSLRVESR